MNCKLVCVGDGGVGKTCFLFAYTEKRFPTEYVPSMFDNFTTTITVDGRHVTLALWDLHRGGESYKRLRALSYPETDVFLAIFSVVRRTSFENIKTTWVPEVTHHVPSASVLLVGAKSDLRGDATVAPEDEVTPEEAKELARELGCAAYLENSALKGKGLTKTIETAIKITMGTFDANAGVQRSNSKRSGCLLS